MTSLALAALTLAEDASSDGDLRGLVFLLLLLGPLVYWIIYTRYRNPGARYHYEQDTEVKVDGTTGSDTFVQRRTHTTDEILPGANSKVLKGVSAKGKRGATQRAAQPPGIVP